MIEELLEGKHQPIFIPQPRNESTRHLTRSFETKQKSTAAQIAHQSQCFYKLLSAFENSTLENSQLKAQANAMQLDVQEYQNMIRRMESLFENSSDASQLASYLN